MDFSRSLVRVGLDFVHNGAECSCHFSRQNRIARKEVLCALGETFKFWRFNDRHEIALLPYLGRKFC